MDPQGSVLGPLLFLVYYYVNGMGNAVPNHIIKLFANDTNLFVFGDNITNIIDTVNHDILLNKLYNYGVRGVSCS